MEGIEYIKYLAIPNFGGKVMWVAEVVCGGDYGSEVYRLGCSFC
jgi:hypothetical protein